MVKKCIVSMAEKKKVKDKEKAVKKGLVAIGTLAVVGAIAAIVLDPKVKEKKEEVVKSIKEAHLKATDAAQEASEAIKDASVKVSNVSKELKEGYKDVKHDIHRSASHISKELK